MQPHAAAAAGPDEHGHNGQVLPLVFEALYTNSRSHWNSTVHGLTCNVVKLFMEMDAKLFDDCSAQYRERQEAEAANAQKKLEEWASIEKMAETSPLYARCAHTQPPSSPSPLMICAATAAAAGAPIPSWAAHVPCSCSPRHARLAG